MKVKNQKNFAWKKFYNNRFCFRIEDIPEEYRHLYSSVSSSHEPLYYETDNVRKTKIEDMRKVPEFASKYAKYVELFQTKSDLKSQKEQKEKQKKEKQNNDIRQVEQLLNIRMSPTKTTGYFDASVHIHVNSKNASELTIEESQIKAKLNELFMDAKIDLRTRNELQLAVMHLYASWRKNAPKPVVSSKAVVQSTATETNDYDERTQEEQQIVVDQKEPSKFRPIISEDVKKSFILRDKKQKLHEMKEQFLDYQEQQAMNQEVENEEEKSQGMSM